MGFSEKETTESRPPRPYPPQVSTTPAPAPPTAATTFVPTVATMPANTTPRPVILNRSLVLGLDSGHRHGFEFRYCSQIQLIPYRDKR
ncbi:hypothetical protein EVAR_59694_1 [Eumeta japonica]|uniref:Uncharacterized protein n=1 Tax=Eumeta variegata TaxID=151549 RepID=A0A4C1ZA83_EUMVA|nr:hypothetical protein EVAR_59694_1 [Eumeta japonica]